MNPVETNALSAQPVKAVFERHLRPGAESSLTAWAERFVAAARQSGGLEGSSVLAPENSGSIFVLLRFASNADLERWQASTEYLRLWREADSLSASDHPLVRTGMETWFTLPGSTIAHTPPPKWKMALTTWIGLFPMVVALGYLFRPLELPVLAAQALSTIIPTAMLTWVVMPNLTRLLYKWLYSTPQTT